jgi:CRP-like cAMP-binding protein
MSRNSTQIKNKELSFLMAIETLLQDATCETFTAGQNIFELGDTGGVMYVLMEGEVDIIVRDQVYDTVSAGGILGEMALIDSRPRSAAAVAKTDCKVVPINEERFIQLVSDEPAFALQVMRVMVERLRYMNAMV